RAGRLGRATGVDDGEGAVLPEWRERRQRGMEREEAVEIERPVALTARGRLERDRRTGGPVRRVAVGHDHAEPVHGATLEDRDEDLAPGGSRRRGSDEERRRTAERHERASPALEEGPSVHRGSPIAVGTRASRGPARRGRRRWRRGRGPRWRRTRMAS